MSSKEIINRIKEFIPKEAGITDYQFEGANIVLYSSKKDFVLTCKELTRDIVNTIKKRVEVRADEALLMDSAAAEKIIRKACPNSSELEDVWFDEKRSLVFLEAGKPDELVANKFEIVNQIVEKTMWTPVVRRKPAIKSNLIKNIRLTLFNNSNYRRKFLHSLGERIYSDWQRDNKYWIRMSCLGGFREVGRSCMLIQTPESRVLLDCGVNIAASDEYAYPMLDAPEFDINRLDAIIVSHSHLDHVGFIPYLFKLGYKGPVYCSEPTRDVMTMLAMDYIDIAEKENKKLLYNSSDVKEMVKNIVSIPIEEVHDITPDFRLTLFNAGHILGSAMVHLNIGNGYHNLLYTGDYKFAPTELLENSAFKFQRVETLITESTYGGANSIQPSHEDCVKFFSEIVKNTINRGGKLLVPVLGVGRAQEVMLIIDRLMKNKEIPEIPVYVDGMVWDITAIYTAYPEFFNRNVRKMIFQENYNPFLNPNFKQPTSQKDRIRIMEEGGPCVLLATSGMLTGGPSVFYLEHIADNPKNSLVFVSYQGKGSLGRVIQSGEKEITLRISNNKRQILPINLEVYTIEGLSGHSDRNQLMNFMTKLSPKPKKIIICHGESSNAVDLASSIYKKLRIETIAPKNLDALRLS